MATDPGELAALAGYYRFNRLSESTFQKAMGLAMTLRVQARDQVLLVNSPVGMMRLVQVEPLLFQEEIGSIRVVIRTDAEGRPTHALISSVPMMAAERVPWHGAPPLHFALLGAGMLLFVGTLFHAPVRWMRRRRQGGGGEEDRGVRLARRGLQGAAAAHLGFVLAVLVMAGPNLFTFLTTPMTGFMVALALPVAGVLATGVAAWGVGLQWRRGAGGRLARVGMSGAVVLALLFAWSLYYWNLLGWHV
jgi:hypothetical protein